MSITAQYILNQEIIKVRGLIPHIGPLTKVILLELFLNIVLSSSADITRVGWMFSWRISLCFVSFRFVSKESKISNSVGCLL